MGGAFRSEKSIQILYAECFCVKCACFQKVHEEAGGCFSGLLNVDLPEENSWICIWYRSRKPQKLGLKRSDFFLTIRKGRNNALSLFSISDIKFPACIGSNRIRKNVLVLILKQNLKLY